MGYSRFLMLYIIIIIYLYCESRGLDEKLQKDSTCVYVFLHTLVIFSFHLFFNCPAVLQFSSYEVKKIKC